MKRITRHNRTVGEVGMTETDKLLVRISTARDAISRKTEQTSLDYMIDGVLMNCSVMLKEQENEKKRNPVIVCPHCGKRVK